MSRISGFLTLPYILLCPIYMALGNKCQWVSEQPTKTILAGYGKESYPLVICYVAIENGPVEIS